MRDVGAAPDAEIARELADPSEGSVRVPRFLVVDGELQREDGVVNLQAQAFTPPSALGGADAIASRNFR